MISTSYYSAIHMAWLAVCVSTIDLGLLMPMYPFVLEKPRGGLAAHTGGSGGDESEDDSCSVHTPQPGLENNKTSSRHVQASSFLRRRAENDAG